MTVIEDLLDVGFGWDQLVVLIFIIFVLFQKNSFLKDWIPYVILWFTYDILTTIVDIHNHVNVKPIYEMELFLFGWMFGGEIPAFWAQKYQNVFLSFVFAMYYSFHAIMPLIVASTIYYKSKDRVMFKEFTYAFLITSYLAIITFVLYPVAPPWYIWNDGGAYKFSQPGNLTHIPGSAAGLMEVDKLLGTDIFASYYGRFNANPFAALPSLHASYAFLTAYYVIKKYGWERAWWMSLYPIGVMFAAVYLNHHFIVDLILGVGYTLIGIRFAPLLTSILVLKRNKMEGSPEGENEEIKSDNGKPIDKVQQVEQELYIKQEIGD